MVCYRYMPAYLGTAAKSDGAIADAVAVCGSARPTLVELESRVPGTATQGRGFAHVSSTTTMTKHLEERVQAVDCSDRRVISASIIV